MAFPAVEGLSRTRIRRYAGEVALLAFAAGYGFGQVGSGDWGAGAAFYARCAIVIVLLLLLAYRLRRVPSRADSRVPITGG